MSRYLRPLGSAEGKRVEVQLKELRDAAKALKLTVEEIETQADVKG